MRYAAKYKLLIKEETQDYKEEKEETVSDSQISYTFSNLNQSTTYTIKIEAESEKREKAEKEKAIKINTVPTPTITIANADTWTNTGKSVSITTLTDYTTKYTTDGTVPSASNGTTYSGAFTISDNNTTITAVYLDSTNQVGAGSTNTVTKIDTTEPETLDIKLTPNKTSIKVDITQATDTISGIAGYRFSKDNGATWTSYQTEKSYTFTNLYGDLAGVKCTIIVETKDNAGNIKQVAQDATTTCLNTTYYKNTANETLFTIDGREFYKYNNLGAICAVQYHVLGIDTDVINWTGPVLVSTDADAVRYLTTYNYSVCEIDRYY